MNKKIANVEETRSFETVAAKKTASPASSAEKEFKEEYIELPVKLVVTESNIRTVYDDNGIEELSKSIQQYGQLEPISVYEQGDEYVVIFGHRRLLAVRKANLKTIKCIVRQKPDTLEKLYIQAVENEHSAHISSSDREKYIKKLHKDYKQSVSEIALKLGKSESWIYASLEAHKSREINERIFNQAGLTMTTEDAKIINNASEEEIQEAVNLIVNNPGNKTKILTGLKKKNTVKKGSKTAKIKKEPETAALPAEPLNPLGGLSEGGSSETPETPPGNAVCLKDIKLEISISFDDQNKNVTFKTSSLGTAYDPNILPLLLKRLSDYYNAEGYKVLK